MARKRNVPGLPIPSLAEVDFMGGLYSPSAIRPASVPVPAIADLAPADNVAIHLAEAVIEGAKHFEGEEAHRRALAACHIARHAMFADLDTWARLTHGRRLHGLSGLEWELRVVVDKDALVALFRNCKIEPSVGLQGAAFQLSIAGQLGSVERVAWVYVDRRRLISLLPQRAAPAADPEPAVEPEQAADPESEPPAMVGRPPKKREAVRQWISAHPGVDAKRNLKIVAKGAGVHVDTVRRELDLKA
jgi:hypothetical protein